MKLATIQDGSRDGQLLVVARDLATAHYATGIASTLQQALEDWNFFAPQLQDLYDALNQGRARHAFAFEPLRCLAPLPRAYQCGWLPDAQQVQWHHGLSLQGPRVPLHLASGAPVSAAMAVITDDVAAGASAEQALESVRLVLTLLRPDQADAPWHTSPVAITLDELQHGDQRWWRADRVHWPLRLRGAAGAQEPAVRMTAPWSAMLARAVQTQALGAGALLAAPVASATMQSDLRLEWIWPDGVPSLGAVVAVLDGAAA